MGMTMSDNAFCSRECALEYYAAKKLEKEEGNDDEEI
jgi:hypothetical protein